MMTFLNLMGAQYLSPTVFWLLLGLAVTGAAAVAWFADAIMGDSSFGIIGNSIIVLIGAIGTIMLWHRFQLPTQREYVMIFGLAICMGSVGLLLGLSFLRRFG